MFGEKPIILNKTLHLDSKNRIVIPSSTGIEIDEKIGIMFDLYKQKLLLYQYEEFINKLDVLSKKLNELKSSKKISYKEYLRYSRYIFAILSFPESKADSHHRVTLPLQGIKTLSIQDNIYAVGYNNHLEIYKDIETYELLKQK